MRFDVRLPLCALLVASCAALRVEACTIFYACDGATCFGGNNEDWSDPNAFMWFEPGAAGEHGAVYFGFGNAWPQGGMNEAGLFFDGAATQPLPLESTIGRKPFRRDIFELMMKTCSTVDEAVGLLQQYDLQFMERAMIFLGDAGGNSAIYEGDEVVRKPADARHQVVTNFYQSRQTTEEAQCWRKVAAEKRIASRFSHDEPLTLDLMRDVLDATHQEGKFGTKYSNVYDLKRGFIHLYRNHDFEHVLTVSLKSELALGAHKVTLADLFAAPEKLVAWPWNTHCPNSGKVVPRDREDCYFEHDGVRVYYCNPHCASDGATVPEESIARVYGPK